MISVIIWIWIVLLVLSLKISSHFCFILPCQWEVKLELWFHLNWSIKTSEIWIGKWSGFFKVNLKWSERMVFKPVFGCWVQFFSRMAIRVQILLFFFHFLYEFLSGSCLNNWKGKQLRILTMFVLWSKKRCFLFLPVLAAFLIFSFYYHHW